MKLRNLILCLLVFYCSHFFAQNTNNITDFLKEGGAKLCSNLAHPTNTFKRASWEYGYNSITISILSHDNWGDKDVITKISMPVKGEGYYFGKIRVIHDDDFGAFGGLGIMKSMLNEEIRNNLKNSDKSISKVERFLGKSVTSMDAYETAAAITTLFFWIHLGVQ